MSDDRCRPPPIYENLAQGEREVRRMFRDAPSQIISAGEVLIARERPTEVIFELHRGWACRIREWPDGRRVIPEIYLPGDFIGVEAALRARRSDHVAATEPVMAKVLDAGSVSGLLARPSTGTYLAWLLAEAQRRAEDRADRLARLDAAERLADMLLDLYRRLRRRELATSGSFNLPLTQQQIADYLGLTVVHVNRTLRLLREEKIVVVDRHIVMIRDMPRLLRLAGCDPSNTTLFRNSTAPSSPMAEAHRR